MCTFLAMADAVDSVSPYPQNELPRTLYSLHDADVPRAQDILTTDSIIQKMMICGRAGRSAVRWITVKIHFDFVRQRQLPFWMAGSGSWLQTVQRYRASPEVIVRDRN